MSENYISLVAYHNDPAIKRRYLYQAREYITSGKLGNGESWDGVLGGCLGYSVNYHDPMIYEAELGIPGWLGLLQVALCSNMNHEHAEKFALMFLEGLTVGCDFTEFKPFVMTVLLYRLSDIKACPAQGQLSIWAAIALWQRHDYGTVEWDNAADTLSRVISYCRALENLDDLSLCLVEASELAFDYKIPETVGKLVDVVCSTRSKIANSLSAKSEYDDISRYLLRVMIDYGNLFPK